MNRKYEYSFCCVDCPEEQVQEMGRCLDEARDVRYETLLRNCRGLLEWAVDKGYDKRCDIGLTLKDDDHVSFMKGIFNKTSCYILQWSGIEYFWLKGSPVIEGFGYNGRPLPGGGVRKRRAAIQNLKNWGLQKHG